SNNKALNTPASKPPVPKRSIHHHLSHNLRLLSAVFTFPITATLYPIILFPVLIISSKPRKHPITRLIPRTLCHLTTTTTTTTLSPNINITTLPLLLPSLPLLLNIFFLTSRAKFSPMNVLDDIFKCVGVWRNASGTGANDGVAGAVVAEDGLSGAHFGRCVFDGKLARNFFFIWDVLDVVED
ncbi:hypothetical protein BKA64DRAFT_173813, partial [Cadophora sp. MPI-SDFR-AT-0126]